MGAATRGKLIRRLKVKEVKPLIAVPAALRAAFRDGYDGQFVVESGRHRRRVNLALSSGGELVFPDWLRASIAATAAPDDNVSIYLSTRPLWLVEGEQAEAIGGIVARHGRQTKEGGEPRFTTPVQLSPKLPSLDRVSEILDVVEGEDHRT